MGRTDYFRQQQTLTETPCLLFGFSALSRLFLHRPVTEQRFRHSVARCDKYRQPYARPRANVKGFPDICRVLPDRRGSAAARTRLPDRGTKGRPRFLATALFEPVLQGRETVLSHQPTERLPCRRCRLPTVIPATPEAPPASVPLLRSCGGGLVKQPTAFTQMACSTHRRLLDPRLISHRASLTAERAARMPCDASAAPDDAGQFIRPGPICGFCVQLPAAA